MAAKVLRGSAGSCLAASTLALVLFAGATALHAQTLDTTLWVPN